ncbi:hypothetical protein V2G26_006060 [Clonostachys chloroleuca]
MVTSTPSVESLTRSRLAVAAFSALAAVSIGLYAYHTNSLHFGSATEPRLHRSNAIRRTRRSRRRDTDSTADSDDAAGDENTSIPPARPLAETEPQPADNSGDEWLDDGGQPPNQRAGHNIVNLLFRVSEDNAKRNGCVHRGCQCNSCGMVPIRGVRYRCSNCADFDLCETCESQCVHTRTHVFYKIRVPAPPFGPRQMQPVWYTGDPDTCRRNLPKNLIAKLTKETGFERPELEAFWEQWTFMANTEWREDPDELFLAMDRKTFERCLVPTGRSRHAPPNLIHDRMFTFYDWNKDGYIGFSEFLIGLSYRKRKDKLRKIFEGYDIDGDGYVSRKDFLRMFRAYYVLYKQMHKDILDGLEDQLFANTEAQQLVASRQPLSSLFGREGGVPSGDEGMRFEGKTVHRDGTVEVDESHQAAVSKDKDDTASRQDILASLFAYDGDWPSRWQSEARVRLSSGEEDDQNHDRNARTLGVTEGDRPYLVTLIEPPTSLDELPDAVMGDHTLAVEDVEHDAESGDEETEHNGYPRPMNTEIEDLIEAQNYTRQRLSKSEKRRRDMARSRLHDRWRRRDFYLDQEEGGTPPEGYTEADEYPPLDETEVGESSMSTEHPSGPSRSRSSSKVRFAHDDEDDEGRFNHSASSRGMSERWRAPEIPSVERDAGKEIMYQVTQQAFNELLDAIFKPSEDLYIEARKTKKMREKFRDMIDAFDMPEDGNPPEGYASPAPEVQSPKVKSLEDLLAETGYSIDPEVDQDAEQEVNPEIGQIGAYAAEWRSHERDPTFPQFRPNRMTCRDVLRLGLTTYPDTRPPQSETGSAFDITEHHLYSWKRLNAAEEEAAARKGWGKLSFEEFEEIYRNQEFRGNRLDYLGSWIDFCIP